MPGGVRTWLSALPGGEQERSAAAALPSRAGGHYGRAAASVRGHPLMADMALVVALAAVSAPQLVAQRDLHGTDAIVLGVLLLAPLVWRRRHPFPVFAAIAAVAFAQWAAGMLLVADSALLVGLYTVATRCHRRTTIGAAAILELGAALAPQHWPGAGGWPQVFVFLSGLVAASLLLGLNVGDRRANLALLTDRAERLEAERDHQAVIAAAAERARIAREMHDIVAHSLAVMVSLADGAALKQARDPGQSATAIGQVSATGRQALSDMRRLLGVLRTDDLGGDRRPQPGVGQIDALIAQIRSTGLAVELTTAGLPPAMSPAAEVTLYRIVQEALTNTLKHAINPTGVHVALRYQPTSVSVEVNDDGASVPPGRAAGMLSGHGLTGMRERAAAYGGEISVGPRPTGGWRVRVDLPNDAAVALAAREQAAS
jgi:signal transduction histidine kinase